MAHVREAFRLRRIAHVQRGLWLHYLEHDSKDAATGSRQLMIEQLRNACQQWRLALGIAS